MIIGISLDINELNKGISLLSNNTEIKHIQIHYGPNTKLSDYKWFVEKANIINPSISFSIHAYNEINFAEKNKTVFSAWCDVSQKTLEDAISINAEFVNFHFGILCDGEKNRGESRKKAINEFISLQKYAEAYQLEIHIENIYSAPSKSDYQYLGDRIEDFNDLFHHSDKIYTCYDLGHGNITPLEDNFYIKHIAKIKSFHVHDNNSINDLHQPVGTGDINWMSVLYQLKKTAYQYYFILEHDANHYDSSLKYLQVFN